MLESYKLNPEGARNATFHLLTELHAQNSVIMEATAEIRSRLENRPIEEVKAEMEAYLLKRKVYILDHIYEHFGHLDNDLLK